MEAQTSAQLRATLNAVIAGATAAAELDAAFAMQIRRHATIECALGAACAAGA